MFKRTAITAVALSVALTVASQDVAAQATVSRPAYPLGEGPVVLLDLGHNNFDHSEFPPVLAEWLTQDGYVLRQLSTRFDDASLADVDIVISKNPLPARDGMRQRPGPFTGRIEGWRLPTPSAFSQGEIEFLYDWVLSGGAFLLQIEHMPMAGAAAELVSRFNFEISDGFALDERHLQDLARCSGTESTPASGIGRRCRIRRAAGSTTFRRSDGSLADHAVTNGRTFPERVDSIETGFGVAFRLPADGQSLLTFGPSHVSLLPDVTWEFDDTTQRQAIGGWSQAGIARVGSGRVALLGDSMLLRSALEEEGATANTQFTLNVIYWLSGLLD